MMMLSSRDRDSAGAFLDAGGASPSSASMASFISAGASALGGIGSGGALGSSSISSISNSASGAGSAGGGGNDAVARLNTEFNQFLRDRELMQHGLLRQLEDSVRNMAQYKERMAREVREFMGERTAELARSLAQTQRRPAVDALVDELFDKPETQRGLLGWLPASLQPRAAELLRDIRLDIGEGNGNGVRTSFNDLLLLYMRALGVQDVLNVVILGEPLGTLITQFMKNYLSSIQQYDLKKTSSGSSTTSASTGGGGCSGSSFDYYSMKGGSSPHAGGLADAADAADDAALLGNFDTDVQRLTGALYCVKNVGNWASHNRGALGFFKQLELCGAMAAMAETLPNVWRMYVRYTDAKKDAAAAAAMAALSVSSAMGVGSPPFPGAPPPLPPSSAPLPPGLLSSASWPSPRGSFSPDAGVLGAASASSSPPRGIWASGATSPSPSSLNSSGSSSAPPLPPGLPPFPMAADQQPRSLFRSLSSSSSSPPPPLPPSQPSAARAGRPPSPVVLPTRAATPKPSFQFYYSRDDDMPQPDGRQKVMFRAMLEHMRVVDKARLCQQGLACPGRLASGQCPESHTYQEVMTYNPLYKLLKCTQADHYSYVDVQEHAWCVCAHVDVGVSTEWMHNTTRAGERNLNSKGYLCEYRERCTNGRCLKSHSEVEICWYNPFFRTKECEFGRSCHFGANCLALHDGQPRRQPSDGYIGVKTKMLFLERTHKAVAEKLVLVDPRFCQ